MLARVSLLLTNDETGCVLADRVFGEREKKSADTQNAVLTEVAWMRRAAARIRERDPLVKLVDAADLAAAVLRRTADLGTPPEQAIDWLFGRSDGRQGTAASGHHSELPDSPLNGPTSSGVIQPP